MKTIIMIDEPELFLHPPQVRHLAQLITKESSTDTQLLIATHSEAFVKGILDFDSDRVIVVRLQRSGDIVKSSVLDHNDIKTLWTDPLLRTSNILSALFHEVAVLMEGETDVLFTKSLMDICFGTEHLPDVEYYSCNGKSKIPQIIKALRSVDVPVVAAVDIDILQNTSELIRAFESLGGKANEVRLDAEVSKIAVESDKSTISGRQLKSELDQITAIIQPQNKVPEAAISQIRELLRRSSPWLRVKQDGSKGISDALATRAFNRLLDKCARTGLLINPEGELEGFCRTISRSNKSEWLSQVLQRNMKIDSQFADARAFADNLSIMIKAAIAS